MTIPPFHNSHRIASQHVLPFILYLYVLVHMHFSIHPQIHWTLWYCELVTDMAATYKWEMVNLTRWTSRWQRIGINDVDLGLTNSKRSLVVKWSVMTAYTSHPGTLYYLPHINIFKYTTDNLNHKVGPITWLTDDDWTRVRKWEAETFTLLRTDRQMISWDDESRGVVDRMGDREGWPSGVECRLWSTGWVSGFLWFRSWDWCRLMVLSMMWSVYIDRSFPDDLWFDWE